ncbi:MAG: PilN domain-containing protein [Pseudomonadota bacterium]
MTGKFLIIDVGDNSIRAYSIGESLKKRSLEDLFRVLFKELPEPEENETLFDAALELMSREVEISAFSDVVVLLPSNLFFYRTTQLPFKTKTRVQQVLPLELRSTFPNENDACLIEFFILNLPVDRGLNSVFSASIIESEIKQYYDSLMKLGVKPAIVAPKGVAMAACFLKMRTEKGNFIFLDAADDEITAILVIDRQPALIRTFAQNSRTPATLPDEVNRMILGFRQRTGLDTGFDIFVSGPDISASSFEALYQALEKTSACQAGQNSGSLAVTEGLNPGFTTEKIDRQGLLSMLSPNRKMQGLFNFSKGCYGSDSFFKAHAKEMISSSILATLVFVFFMVSTYAQIQDLEIKRTQKKQIVSSIFTQTFPGKKVGNVDPLLLMQSLVKQATQSRGTMKPSDTVLNHKGINAVMTLFELSKQIPGSIDVELSRLMLDSERLILSGSTQNFNMVDQLKGFIEKSVLFKKVDISSAAAGKNDGRVEFKFIVEI